ncbi:lytic transglycosylase domain-containing protein [Aeromicrobium wangtongii]|uniref:lytic transglycosylase domain-containing protein n=1 Tax=Aeromicrobium wangtongii TaxID=2969247 RepID=UPI0020171706|nr:lytic murein transglycosylase [Aeromicrobium wangtongii]MCL3819004.1 lytic murein transglycosylase [Aeromicrobium wangtongii]
MKRPLLSLAVAAVPALAIVITLAVAPRDEPAPAATVPPAAPAPSVKQLTAVSKATSIPRRALAAYVAAARTLAREEPSCRIAWNTLAGIGSVESSHGSFAGAKLDAGGVASPRILGVALDGTGGNRAIADTDGGALDGDRRWDRAVGPLQFIPTTWAVYGADGDGDGKVDPHDIDDAALAAGRYLCRAGGDLSGSRGWSEAVLTYNHSGPYARKVSRIAGRYAEAT